jgi:hypothetical protein
MELQLLMHCCTNWQEFVPLGMPMPASQTRRACWDKKHIAPSTQAVTAERQLTISGSSTQSATQVLTGNEPQIRA